jgi:hypothetical protein
LATVLRTVLRDEIITIYRKQVISNKAINLNEDLSVDKSYADINSEIVIQAVTKATSCIKQRLEDLMYYEQNEETKISQLVSKAKNYDYLAYVDPSFYPWM